MNNITIRPIKRLSGEVCLPGDKSISHRSVMLSGLAQTPVVIRNFLYAEDCLSTARCMQGLGAKVKLSKQERSLIVEGNGLQGLAEPKDVLDAGNSGTTMRLLAGILGAQPFFSILSGDLSLRSRPMKRITDPLSRMGCRIIGRDNSRFAPLAILPAAEIRGISYQLPVASAQIKSALLLAGLFACGKTEIIEPGDSRDHTERMLEAFGVKLEKDGRKIRIEKVEKLKAPDLIEIPGDISSAAFWIVAATIIPGSEVVIRNVGINPTRTGILDVLKEMGAKISFENLRQAGNEPVADIVVKAADIKGITIGSEIMPRLIDEIPILTVAAVFAKGTTTITGAGELRVKETDRLHALAAEFGKLGANITETPDGLVIEGTGSLEFAACESYDDHRIAMALAVAGIAAQGVEIERADCVRISYPEFFTTLTALGH